MICSSTVMGLVMPPVQMVCLIWSTLFLNSPVTMAGSIPKRGRLVSNLAT